MAEPKRTLRDWPGGGHDALQARLGLATETSQACASPAFELQRTLELAFASEPQVKKWPGAVRLGVLATLAIVPWAVIGLGLRALLH